MKMSRKSFVFIIFILSALIVGAYISEQSDGGLLSYTKSFGFGKEAPMELNLIIFTISLGFTFNISIAQILCIVVSFILFTIFSKFIE